jgi:hypothetical protein
MVSRPGSFKDKCRSTIRNLFPSNATALDQAALRHEAVMKLKRL